MFMFHYGGILWLIVVVLDVLAIVNCIKRPMSTDKKILWVVLILILPIIGLILYYLLGRGK
jgi:hypothetical protein